MFWFRVGWMGVDLFFVLSGFLISGLLFQDYERLGIIRIKRFWIRRGWKIWPAFYVYLVVAFLVSSLLNLRSDGHPFLVSAFYLKSYFPRGNEIVTHIWSLAVEEHFYLILPILLAVLIRRGSISRLPYLCLSILMLSPILRAFSSPGLAMYATHLRLDGLFCGVGLGYLFHFQKERFNLFSRWYSAFVAALLILSVVMMGDEGSFDFPGSRSTCVLGFTFLAVAFALLLAWSIEKSPPRFLRPLAYIGIYSYSIYLWHFVASIFLRPLDAYVWSAAVYIFVAIGLGVSMSKLIEMPFVRLRDRVTDRTSYVSCFQPELSQRGLGNAGRS